MESYSGYINAYTFFEHCIKNSGSKAFPMLLKFPILRPLSSKAHGCKDFWKLSKPCHVGIYWIALTEYSQMSTHMPGFQSVFSFMCHFVLAKLASSSIRVEVWWYVQSDCHNKEHNMKILFIWLCQSYGVLNTVTSNARLLTFWSKLDIFVWYSGIGFLSPLYWPGN